MPASSQTIPAMLSKIEFFKKLKSSVPESALETLEADPEGKRVPPEVAELLGRVKSSPESLATSGINHNCITQKPNPIPSSNPMDLFVGIGDSIPRWKKGSVINFAVLSKGFPTTNHAIFAAQKLQEAATNWNKAKVGVTFKWVTPLEDACFALTWGGANDGVLASAFFPNAEDLNSLFVYTIAYDKRFLPFLSNVFEHELGHVLGLRHEFAQDPDSREKDIQSTQFGPRNYYSVMNYSKHGEPPHKIQPSDIEWTRKFYDLPQSVLGGMTILDYEPDN